MFDPTRLEAGIQMLAEACPDQQMRTWDLLRTTLRQRPGLLLCAAVRKRSGAREPELL